MKLLIAIPALNEEESIASTVAACLDAREPIIAGSDVTEVEVVVVSDGSTDRTVEIAEGFGDRIRLVVFPENRGYGAAIAGGWAGSDADLLGFLDADGTCDPVFFAPLCREIVEHDADVVLGCRLNADSEMPLQRRVGNTLFAWLMRIVSRQRVRDTASGMRVVRRASLRDLLPLPKGLHFTPAMSARAILCEDLTIREIDMTYSERAGESKLHPIRDGLRFLGVILKTALLYKPGRLLGLAAWAFFGLAVVMMAQPVVFYLGRWRLEEWMIYRFLVAQMLASSAVIVWCVGHLGQKAADVSLAGRPSTGARNGVLGRLLAARWFPALPAASFVIGFALVFDALGDFVLRGEVHEHWSRFVASMFFESIAVILVASKVADYCLDLLVQRLAYVRNTGQPDVAAAFVTKV